MEQLDSTHASIPVEKDALRIAQTRAFSYRVPGTNARTRHRNYIVELTVSLEGQKPLVGVGEGQPRGSRTGDDAGDSWALLEQVVERLYGTLIPISDVQETVDHIKKLMAQFAEMAGEHARQGYPRIPFRGTLLAVEMALLDVAARSHNIPLVDLFGEVRRFAPLAPPAVLPSMDDGTIHEFLQDHDRAYGLTRVVVPRSAHGAIDFLEKVATLRRQTSVDASEQPFWIALQASLPSKQAALLVLLLVRSVRAGRMPRQIIVQNLTSRRRMAVMQQWMSRIAKLLPAQPMIDIRLMSSWDPAKNNERLTRVPRVLDLRPARVGGLLRTLEVARAAHASDPDTCIILSRMPGASRVTSSALRHLALALPRVDAVELSANVEHSLPITTGIQKNGSSAERNASEGETYSREVAGEQSSEGAGELDIDESKSPDDSTRSVNAEYEHLPIVDEPEDRGAIKGGARVAQVRRSPGLGIELDYPELVNPTVDYVAVPAPPLPALDGRPPRSYPDVDYIRPMGSYAVHGHLMEREALAYGFNTWRFSKSTFTLDDGIHDPLVFRTARSPLTGVTASSIVRHKESTRILLRRAGCPVPEGRTFNGQDIRTVLDYAERIGYPVVVKPAAGSMGVGVTANIANRDELRSALTRFHSSVMGHDELIVEQHIPGRDYRIMVLGDRVIAAVERIPASVIGDGRSTIADLIQAKNQIRRSNPHLGPLRIKWNSTSIHEIEKAGLTGNSVLPAGHRVYLNSANNLTQGGDSIEVLDEMHPSILEASVEAVKAVPGLAYCGVDFLLEDHRKPLDQQFGAICELNAVAAIPVAEYPMFGKPRPLAEEFLLECVRNSGLRVQAKRSDHLNLRLQVKGKVMGVGYMGWFARRARSFGCNGWIRANGKYVEIKLSGPTAAASALVMSAVLGPPRSRPTSVRTTHEDTPSSEGFDILPARRKVLRRGRR